MRGLQTGGLASGFAQGFGLVNDYQRGQRADARADEQLNMQREKFDMQKAEIARARDMEDIQFAWGKIANQMELSDQEIELFRRYPKFARALDQMADQYVAKAEAVLDPSTPDDLNDPDAIDGLNTLLGDEINKGGDGQKRIIAALPAPDGQSLAFELEVTDKDGQNPYRAPMTAGRGTEAEGDDQIKTVPVESIVNQVAGFKALRQALATPEAKAYAQKMLHVIQGTTPEKWEQVDGPRGSLLQREVNSGKMGQVVAPYNPSSGINAANLAIRENQAYLNALTEQLRFIDDVVGSDDWRRMSDEERAPYLAERARLQADFRHYSNLIRPGGALPVDQPAPEAGGGGDQGGEGDAPPASDGPKTTRRDPSGLTPPPNGGAVPPPVANNPWATRPDGSKAPAPRRAERAAEKQAAADYLSKFIRN